MCRFKTSPCAGSKRFRVYQQHADMFYTCGHVAGTHKSVWNRHTETFRTRREGGRGGFSSLSLVPSLFLSTFFFLSSVVLFIRSLSLLSFLLSSLFSVLSATMTMITRPVGSLCVHTALTCQSVRVHGPWPIPCWPNMFAACKKQLSRYDCASLVPLGMMWACICGGNGCCVWWCL